MGWVAERREDCDSMGCEFPIHLPGYLTYLALLLPCRSQYLRSRSSTFSQVLSEKIPDRDTKLQTHIAAFPDEEEELVDSASSLGGKPREPTIEKFLPIGHISLYTEYETPGLEFTVFKPEEGVCWIATFYISHVLQSAGLGRAAMDTIEATATSHPLNAKVLALSTVARDYGTWVFICVHMSTPRFLRVSEKAAPQAYIFSDVRA